MSADRYRRPNALQRVRPTISVGGHELMMATVTIEQKIKLSGSLKASLEEICEFVAEGRNIAFCRIRHKRVMIRPHQLACQTESSLGQDTLNRTGILEDL